MPRKRPPSKVELDYRRERKRIQNFIRRAQKRGYTFVEPKTGEFFEMPAIPKKITEASVRRLKKFTPQYLYSKSVKATDTGEYEPGLVARKRERSEQAKKSAATMRRRRERIARYQPLDEIRKEAEKRARREREEREFEQRQREAFEQGVRDERERQRQIEEQRDRERREQLRRELEEYGLLDEGAPDQPSIMDSFTGQELPELPNRDTLIIDRTREAWSQYSSGQQYGTIVGWLNNLIASEGEEFAADVLEMAESAGVVPEGYEFYNGDAAEKYINELISFVGQKGIGTYGMTADQMEALGMLDEFL